MGIRFACHVCEKQLNIKQELAGRRGICPSCSSRFRIPLQDAEKSSPVENKVAAKVALAAGVADTAHQQPVSHQASRPTDSDHQQSSSEVGAGTKLATDGAASGSTASNFTADIFDDEPDSTWYVRPPSGGQYGPASGELLKEWIKEGRVASSALLWRDGWPQWRDASEVLPELLEHLPNSNNVGRGGDQSFPSTTPADADTQATPSPQADSRSKAEPTLEMEPRFSGQSDVGANRRSRSTKRVMLIGLLSALAFTLLGVLFYVVNR